MIGACSSNGTQEHRQKGRQDGQEPIFVKFRLKRAPALRRILHLFLLACVVAPGVALAEAPVFSDAGPLATDTGHLLLEWDAPGEVTLLVSGDSAFSDAKPLYRGEYDAYFVSGLADGTYYLTLEGEDGLRSAPVMLNVAHQSLSRALWLTLIGLVITLGIVVTIIRGAHDDG